MSPDRSLAERMQARVQARVQVKVDALANASTQHGPRAIHGHVTRPIVRQLARIDAHSVLDFGCGNGWFTGALDRCGFDVTGVDSDGRALEFARQHVPGLKLRQFDVLEPLDHGLVGAFDAVVAIDLIDHVRQPRKLIDNAMVALRPGGMLIVTSTFHGYTKNLLLALGGRFDTRWESLLDQGRTKFFSRATLCSLMAEFDLHGLHFETVGRVPMFARSMLVSATKPGLITLAAAAAAAEPLTPTREAA